jgi:hypothetical protein
MNLKRFEVCDAYLIRLDAQILQTQCCARLDYTRQAAFHGISLITDIKVVSVNELQMLHYRIYFVTTIGTNFVLRLV